MNAVKNTIKHLNSLLSNVCEGQLTITFGKYRQMMRLSEVASYTAAEAASTNALSVANASSDAPNHPNHLLCLMFNGRCISSIEMRISGRSVEISSKTHPKYEGRRYNLLLRAAAILIASQIPVLLRLRSTHTMRLRSSKSYATNKSHTTNKSHRNRSNQITTYLLRLVSRAINPISTLLLVKYFNAENKEFDAFLQNNGIEKPVLTLQQVRDFEDARWDDVADEDIENNVDFGEPLLLIVNFKNKTTMRRVKQVFIETLERIGCP